MYKVDRSVYETMIRKSMSNNQELEELKRELIKRLEECEKKEKSRVRKAIIEAERNHKYIAKSNNGYVEMTGYPVGAIITIGEVIKGAKANIGEHRTWNGQEYVKIAEGKWRPFYRGNTKGAKLAAAAIAKKISGAKDINELMHIVSANMQRFGFSADGENDKLFQKLRDAQKNWGKTATPKTEPAKEETKNSEVEKLMNQKKAFEDKLKIANEKLKKNPDNPMANADKVDATNAINEIESQIKRKSAKANSEEKKTRTKEDVLAEYNASKDPDERDKLYKEYEALDKKESKSEEPSVDKTKLKVFSKEVSPTERNRAINKIAILTGDIDEYMEKNKESLVEARQNYKTLKAKVDADEKSPNVLQAAEKKLDELEAMSATLEEVKNIDGYQDMTNSAIANALTEQKSSKKDTRNVYQKMADMEDEAFYASEKRNKEFYDEAKESLDSYVNPKYEGDKNTVRIKQNIESVKKILENDEESLKNNPKSSKYHAYIIADKEALETLNKQLKDAAEKEESEAEKHQNRSDAMKGNKNAYKGVLANNDKIKFVNSVKGEPYETYMTNPDVFAIYFNPETGKETGMSISKDIADIIDSHNEPNVLDWKDNIATDIRKKYPDIDRSYITANIGAIRMGYRSGKKQNILVHENVINKKAYKGGFSDDDISKMKEIRDKVSDYFNKKKMNVKPGSSDFDDKLIDLANRSKDEKVKQLCRALRNFDGKTPDEFQQQYEKRITQALHDNKSFTFEENIVGEIDNNSDYWQSHGDERPDQGLIEMATLLKLAQDNVKEVKNNYDKKAFAGAVSILKNMKKESVHSEAFDEVIDGFEKLNKKFNPTESDSEGVQEGKAELNEKSVKAKTFADIKKNYSSAKSITGNTKNYRLPNGEKIKCHYKIVEAETPTASHDETTYQKTPGFPENKDGSTINDRDYAHDVDAQESVRQIAGKFNGLAIQDPPIVTKDGIVVSGNNRTMSSKLAAKNGTDKEYLNDLAEECEDYGIDADELKNFKHPRLILEMDEEHKGDYTTEEFAKFNQDGKKAMNATEKAVKVSKTIKADTVSDIASTLNDFETMADMWTDKKAAANVIDSLVNGGVIGRNDVSQYYTEAGGMSEAGKEFVETVLIGSVMNENNIRQLSGDGGKAIRQKLVRSIVPLIDNKGMGNEYSFNNELNEAVKICCEVMKDRKHFPDIQTYLKQQNMFEEPPSEITQKLAEMIDGTSQKGFADKMKSLNAGLRPGANGEMDMFLGRCETRDEVMDKFLSIKKAISAAISRFFKRLSA